MINFNQIVTPLEHAIVSWVNTYPLTVQVNTLQDLTNSQFYLFMLRRVQHFSLIENVRYSVFNCLTLGERVTRMKMVGRSMLRYLESELLVDISQLRLNFLQMCKGSREETIRMFIVLMNIIIRNQAIRGELQQYIETCSEEDAALLKVMADYASRVGEVQSETVDSPENKQKRLITRLQILEQQVEFFEEYTHQLQTQIEALKEDCRKERARLQQCESREKQMLDKIEQLETAAELYAKEILAREQRQELLNGKISKSRQVADEVVSALTQQLQQQKNETDYYKQQLEKYSSVDALNKELMIVIDQQKGDAEALRTKLTRSVQAVRQGQGRVTQLQDRCSSLLVQNEGLKLRLELMQKSCINNDTMHYSPQQKSITCHNQLSQSFCNEYAASPLFNYQSRLQEMNERSQMGESLKVIQSKYIEERTDRSSRNKENINRFNVIAQSEDGRHCMDGIDEERSLMELSVEQIDEEAVCKRERMEAELLLQVVMQTYQNLQFVRGELRKYQLSEVERVQRNCLFRKKINKMFS